MGTPEQLKKEVQRLKIAVEELTVLNDLAIAASSSMEVDQMLDIIIQKSIKAVRAEQGSISLLTEEKDKPFKTLVRYVDRTNHLMTYKVGTHITGWVLKYQEPLVIENLAKDERFHASEQERKEIRSVLCVPIRWAAKIIGILMMINKKSKEPFSADDLRLLSIIAAQSGQLIRNSQLQEDTMKKKRMEQELELARRIQMDLLPKVEQMPSDLDIASYCNPAEEVGGDYFDYFLLGDKQIGVVIADVSGHGASAAMMMTMVKGILHSIALRFTSADQALLEINSLIIRIVPKGIFITMMFLVFDLEKNVLRVSNAGHNPLLFFDNQAKSCQKVEFKGIALNLTPKATYIVKEIMLKPNDVVFIYTDGVTEAVNEKMEMFEENRLIKGIEEVAKKPAAAIVEHLKTKLNDFTGRRLQEDDIVMLALKIKGKK